MGRMTVNVNTNLVIMRPPLARSLSRDSARRSASRGWFLLCSPVHKKPAYKIYRFVVHAGYMRLHLLEHSPEGYPYFSCQARMGTAGNQ